MPSLNLQPAPPFDIDASPRQWLPAPQKLVDACVGAIEAGQPPGLVDLADQMGAPVTDLVVTPLTARATLMAADHGRAFYHHELRRRLPMPPNLEPEISVWEAGTVPVWSDGVLAEPKYFSFFQDAPFPAFNPNHRRKWRAHELLHGASRWFWRPDMTRFEFYVSARLNELLPVIHWYHLDEVFRPRCPRHSDRVLHREHCLECQRAARPYWEVDAHRDAERVEAAERLVARGWEHFEEEWQAIGLEIESGRRQHTPRARLDASSDAVGYMRAHWNRVTAWSFGHWVETFLIDGVDYYSTLGGLRENVGRSLQQLVSGEVGVAPEAYRARRARAQIQDLGYRVLLALEWLDPESTNGRTAEASLLPELQRCAELANSLLDDPTQTEYALAEFARVCQVFSTVAPRFPEEIGDAFLGFGYRFLDAQVFADAALGQVFTGLEDALPQTADRFDDPVEILRSFCASAQFDAHGRLARRFADFLGGFGDELSGRLKEICRFEAFANDEPRRDEEATLFGALPERAGAMVDEPGLLRPHATLRRDKFRAEVLGQLTGADLVDAGDVAVAACMVDGELRLVFEDEFSTRVLDHVIAGEPIDQWWDFALAEAIMDLLQHQLIVWLPAPRG